MGRTQEITDLNFKIHKSRYPNVISYKYIDMFVSILEVQLTKLN